MHVSYQVTKWDLVNIALSQYTAFVSYFQPAVSLHPSLWVQDHTPDTPAVTLLAFMLMPNYTI